MAEPVDALDSRSSSARALVRFRPRHSLRLRLRVAQPRLTSVAREVQICYISSMTKDQVKEILDRVLTWPQADQEKVARFARQVEQLRDDDGISDDEWRIIEERAARRDLASDEEVEAVFSRYRNA